MKNLNTMLIYIKVLVFQMGTNSGTCAKVLVLVAVEFLTPPDDQAVAPCCNRCQVVSESVKSTMNNLMEK